MPKSKEKPSVRELFDAIRVPYNCKLVERTISGTVRRSAWHYDVLSLTPSPDLSSRNLDALKQATAAQLNRELQQYIHSVYDSGTQATINGYATRALYEDRPDIVAECRKVQDWIDTVLDYYDSVKSLLLSTQTDEDRMLVAWDFNRDVPVTEFVDWRYVKAMFAT